MIAGGSHQTVSSPAFRGSGVDAKSAAAPAGRRPRRVLVVDDYPLMRMVVTDMLRRAGHIVEEAEGGREAIDRLGASSVDLVITDLSMPDLCGWDVARAAHALQPGVPVVLMTGFPSGLDEAPEARHLVAHVLVKPFRCEQILDLITVLTGEGERRSGD